jgi:hypothetical protein
MGDSTPVPGWITSIFQNNIQPNVSYSNTQYKRDAVYILTLLRRISEGHQMQLAELIKETDHTQAPAIAACMDAAKYEDFATMAQGAINGYGCPANNTETYRLFMERFRAGPPARAPTETDIGNGQPGTDTGRHSEKRRGQPAVESHEPSDRRDSGSSGQSHRSRIPGEPDDSDESSSELDVYRGRHRHGHRHGSRRHQYSSPINRRPGKSLKPEDVMLFDPKKISLVSFAKRIRQLSRSYGKEPVLNVIPLCLPGDARDWNTHLSDRITDTMQESLTECIFQLEQHFKKSSFEARRETDKLKFRFAKEKDLSLREYVERKVMLLQEANIKEEDEIVTRVWENLDPVIMNTIRPEDLSLDELTRRLFLQEVPARLAWNQLNRCAPTYTSPRAYSKSKYKDDKPERQKDKGTVKDTKKGVPSKRERLRDCRHCGGPHWDFDCLTGRPAVKAYIVHAGDTEDSLSESDKNGLRDLRKNMEEEYDSNSSD